MNDTFSFYSQCVLGPDDRSVWMPTSRRTLSYLITSPADRANETATPAKTSLPLSTTATPEVTKISLPAIPRIPETPKILVSGLNVPENTAEGFKYLVVAEQKPEEAETHEAFNIAKLVPSEDWQNRMMLIYANPATDARTRARTMENICQAFEKYVHQLAKSRWKEFYQVRGDDGFQDILSAGRLALITAMNNWSPKYRKPLSFLASRWITESCKQEAVNLSQKTLKLPSRVQKLCTDYHKLRSSGKETQAEEMLANSRSRKKTQSVVRELAGNHYQDALSIDASYCDGDDASPTLGESLSDGMNADHVNDRIDLMALIRSILLRKCSARDRFIFFMKNPNTVLQAADIGEVRDQQGKPVVVPQNPMEFGNGKLHHIGALLKITRERVRQLLEEIIAKLKKELSLKGIDQGCIAACA